MDDNDYNDNYNDDYNDDYDNNYNDDMIWRYNEAKREPEHVLHKNWGW